MPWVRVVDSVFDFKPGSTGIVYFKTEDCVNRKTPELQPLLFLSVCAVLARPSKFDTVDHAFRNEPGFRELAVERNFRFSETELNNKEKFESWEIVEKNR